MFKQCNKCGGQWETRDDFLADGEVEIIGYQVFFQNLRLGLFLFNHSCGTTMAVKAEALLDLYTGPVYRERKNDGRDCPGRCLNKNITSPCSEECRCAFISRIIQIVKGWPGLIE